LSLQQYLAWNFVFLCSTFFAAISGLVKERIFTSKVSGRRLYDVTKYQHILPQGADVTVLLAYTSSVQYLGGWIMGLVCLFLPPWGGLQDFWRNSLQSCTRLFFSVALLLPCSFRYEGVLLLRN
jgi:hypothetical protein